MTNNKERGLFGAIVIYLGPLIVLCSVMAWWGITHSPTEPKTSRIEVFAVMTVKRVSHGLPPVGPMIALSGDDYYLEVQYGVLTETFKVSPHEYGEYEVGDEIEACLMVKEWPPRDGSPKLEYELERIDECH